MKMIQRIALLGLLVALALVIYACGSTGSSGGGGYTNVNVQYTVSGDKISHNANQSFTYTIPGAGTDYWELDWYCGNYNGQTNKTVKLTFKKSNNTWILDKEEILGGSCA